MTEQRASISGAAAGSVSEGKAPCPACAAPFETSTYLSRGRDCELRVCSECGLRFTSAPEHPGAAWYEASPIYAEVAWNTPPLEQLANRWEFRQFLAQGLPKNAFLFDVGCGRGDFVALARSRGYDAGGVDLNEQLIRVARERYDLDAVMVGSLDQLGDLPKAPGILTAFEVMEHIADPALFLQQCRDRLVDDGHVCISVPGFDRIPRWFHPEIDMPPHHLTLWTPQSLRAILERSGFDVLALARKPLLASDIMYHVVRRIPGANRPGMGARGLRGLAKGISLVLWSVLRTGSRAGGFTLFACARKKARETSRVASR